MLLCFAVEIARARGQIDDARAAAIQNEIQALPGLVGKVLALFDDIRPIAHRLSHACDNR